MPMSLTDAFEVLAYAEPLHQRLTAAAAALAKKQALKPEKAWMEAAVGLAASARDGLPALVARALALPELEALREGQAKVAQQAAVDAVEQLQAGITFHGGRRSPLLEALFAKFDAKKQRRAARPDFEAFLAAFEKRLGAGYVKRMLADDGLAPARPAVDAVRASFQAWREALSPPPLAEADAKALRAEVTAAAKRVQLPAAQARLLAEAALAPLEGVFEASGLGKGPKRRVGKSQATPAKATSEADAPREAGDGATSVGDAVPASVDANSASAHTSESSSALGAASSPRAHDGAASSEAPASGDAEARTARRAASTKAKAAASAPAAKAARAAAKRPKASARNGAALPAAKKASAVAAG